jgi:iron complex outermembrane recepter protein
MHRNHRFPLVSLLALGMALPAFAQTPPAQPAPQTEPQSQPQAEPQDRERDVVVVTAQKREETVQDIAVAVTAITSDLRDEIGLTTVQDYTNFAPGLSYSTANDRLGMRGVTRTSNNFGIRSGISNYVDGVYFSSAIPASREPIFVERVEVLRGPQGTLYGRDSIGGALNVITKRPTEEFEGQVNIGAGNFDSTKVEATFAGPITDWLRYRVGASRNFQGEGFLTNMAGLESEAGRRDDTYIEAQLEGDIGDRFTWWARYGTLSWHRVGSPGGRTAAGDSQPYDTRMFGPPGSANINSFYGFSGVAQNVQQTGNQTVNPNLGREDQRRFNADFTQFTDLFPTTEGALELIYSFDDFDVKYLGGYVWYHYNLQIDNDGGPVRSYTVPFPLNGTPANTPLAVNRVTDYNENRAWYSNEINFISTGDGPFQWVAGLYQYQENYTQPIYVTSLPSIGQPVFRVDGRVLPDLPDFTGRNANSGSPLGGDLWYFSNNTGLNNAYGVFAQGDYQFNDQWKVTAGLRWSKDVQNGSDQVRYITHYGVNLGGPARVDLTSAATNLFGGPDPNTVTATNPCGFAGKGIAQPNATAANGVFVAGAAQIVASCGGLNDRSRYGIYVDPVTGIAKRPLAASWNEVTGKLGVDWTPDSDTLVYATYNRGYKPGGLGCSDTNCNLTVTPYTDKELVDAFAFGYKREWRDWNLTTNAEVYYYDYQGYQVANTIVPEADPVSGIRPPAYIAYVNLPSTKTSGFELETIWNPIDPLRFLFNYSYTNPEIQESPSLIHALDPFGRDPGAQPQGTRLANGQIGQSLEGNILPFSPKNKTALVTTYTMDFDDGSTADFSLSYFWQDIAYSSVFNRWMTKIPSWDQTDGRVSWTSSDGHFTLIGYVRNLLDETVYDSRGAGRRIGNLNRDPQGSGQPLELCGTSALSSISFPVAAPTGVLPNDCLTITNTYRPPRTWGFELQFHF